MIFAKDTYQTNFLSVVKNLPVLCYCTKFEIPVYFNVLFNKQQSSNKKDSYATICK